MPVNRRVIDSPVAAMLIVAVVYAVYGVLTLAKYQGDITLFIMAGDRYTQAADTPIGIAVESQSDGYDGQFFFRLALDPLTRNRTAFGITLDLPPYRQQRLVYPATAHLLALGHPAWIPWTLVLINYLGVCAMALVGGLYAQSLGRHALWGISLSLYAGLFFSFTGNLAEITEMALLLTALLALQHQRPGWAALLLSLAVLTRETALIAACAVGASYFYVHRQKKQWRNGIVLAAPIVVFLLWQLFLIAHWGQAAGATGAANFGWPAAGLISFLRETISGVNFFVQLLWLLEIVVMGGFAILVLYVLRASRTDPGIKLAWLLYLGIFI